MKALIALLALSALFCRVLTQSDPDRPVIPLTPSLLEKITDPTAGTRTVWFLRFYVPWEKHPSDDVFFSVASSFHPSVARFAEVRMDNVENLAIADAFAVPAFPTIIAINGRTAKPEVKRGSSVSPLGVFFFQDFPKDKGMTDVDAMRKWCLSHIPHIFIDPISTKTISGAPFVNSLEEMKEKKPLTKATYATKALPEGFPTLSFDDAKNLLFYFPTFAESNADLVAAVYALSFANQGHSNSVFLTYSAQLMDTLGASTSEMTSPLFTVVDETTGTAQKATPIASVGDIVEAFKSSVSPVKEGEIQEGYRSRLQEWGKNSAAFAASSPLRKIEKTEIFERDVVDARQLVAVLFFMRASDKFFAKHHKIATEVAEWALYQRFPNMKSKEPKEQARFEVYYIDAEENSEVAKALQVKQVPSVAILVHLTGGKQGIRFFPGELDTSKKIVKFLTSGNLFESREYRPCDVESARFTAGKVVPSSSRSDPSFFNKMYLDFDPYEYNEMGSETNAISECLSAKTEKKEKPEASSEEADAPKLTPEQLKKKKLRQEKEKEKLRKELEAKKKEKEERIRLKAERDKAEREKKMEEAKKRKEEAAKQPKKPKKAPKPKPKAEKKKKPKIPKDSATVKREWERDSAKMAEKYVKSDKAGGVKILHSLQYPEEDNKKK